LWNFTLKIVFVATSWTIVWMMRTRLKASYNREYDSFRQLFVVAPCVAVALLTALVRGDWAPFELLWSFSLWLEALAILPQLVMLQRTGEHEQFTLNYIFCLGLYRALYLVNWVYRAFTETHYHGEWLVWIAGLVQTAGFSDFIYEYLKRYTLCPHFFSTLTLSAAVGTGDHSIFPSERRHDTTESVDSICPLWPRKDCSFFTTLLACAEGERART
jgi:hypothetical protein